MKIALSALVAIGLALALGAVLYYDRFLVALRGAPGDRSELGYAFLGSVVLLMAGWSLALGGLGVAWVKDVKLPRWLAPATVVSALVVLTGLLAVEVALRRYL